jgi:hypothetical protein
MSRKLILEVPTENTPDWWCVPPWHGDLAAIDAKWGKTFLKSGCKVYKVCPPDRDCKKGAVNCDPEAMRRNAESQLQSLGVLGPGEALDADVYTLARNIRSEYGSGTPEERVAIGLASVNRAKQEGTTITNYLLDSTWGLYGKQIGNIRPASTSQDPAVSDILAARFIILGRAYGFLQDFTHGATSYFDRVSQDASAAKAAATEEGRDVPTGAEIYKRWATGGDMLTWCGHMPNVRTWRLAMFAHRYDLSVKRTDSREVAQRKRRERREIYDAGMAAISGSNRTPPPWDACPSVARSRYVKTVGLWLIGVGAISGAALALGVTPPLFEPPTLKPRRA